MAATNLSSKQSKSDVFIRTLQTNYPGFKFKAGKQDHWSPSSKTIIYNPDRPLNELKQSLLHELSHALLDHRDFKSDFELLKLEAEAWAKASELATQYDLVISEDHIQDCLDTYRDWIHRRSTCPSCGVHVLQQDSQTYRCFNCQHEWSVTSGRFVRSYRKGLKRSSH